jgi:hypothetical protein
MIYGILIEKKILKPKAMMADGTVIPEHIKYPNDVGLLNDVREWMVGNIKALGSKVGKTYRTYCRKARKVYLCFSKNRRKTKKQIQRAKKQMLQFVRRNLVQLKAVIAEAKECSDEMIQALVAEVESRIETAEEIFLQQMTMYREKSYRIAKRIVSFWRPWVRPIKRGKDGKDVEFGAKAAMSHVDGFVFVDKIEHENFAEADSKVVRNQIEGYEKRFGKKPPAFIGDRAYGSRDNRKLLEEEMAIRTSFVRLGKKQKSEQTFTRWFKRKQKERNRIEGNFGTGKEHYGLAEAKYHGEHGSEIWTRMNVLAMNLKVAMVRM